MSTSKSNKEFRCPTVGAGGTFRYNDPIKPFGVTPCKTSLGVTFQIDTKRVFCANLAFDGKWAPLSEKDGSKLRSNVLEKLKAISKEERWVINNGVFGHDILYACQYIATQAKDELQKYPAWYMLKGLADFFDECSMKVKAEMTGLLEKKVVGQGKDFMTLEEEYQDRFHKAYFEMAREVQILYGRFMNADLTKPIRGFVVDLDAEGRGLFHIKDAEGNASYVAGFNAGGAAQHKYIAKKFNASDAAKPMYAPPEWSAVSPQGEKWTFSI